MPDLGYLMHELCSFMVIFDDYLTNIHDYLTDS